MNYRDRRVEMHSKYINHLASLMSDIFSDKCSSFELSYTKYFGTSVREDGTEFGVLHGHRVYTIQTSSESHINNIMQKNVFSYVN